MKNNLISVSGKKRSGKNTVATLINKILKEKKLPKYEEKAFAYLVKKFASEMTGIPMEGWETEADKQTELGPEWNSYDSNGLLVPMTRRMFLTKLGSDACNSHLHRNCWVNALFQDYNEKCNWLITDVRFPQEAEAIKSRGGVIIRITRPDTDKLAGNHISETALDKYTKFDFNIVNNGDIIALEEKVRNVLFQLKLI